MRFTVTTEGVQETIDAVKGVAKDLRKEANAEIRAASKIIAGRLVMDLQASASSSGVPVAPRVASSARVKSDRFPTVTVGGTKAVGRRGAPAGRLVWGSERGGRNFAAPEGGEYWIGPTVRRFADSRAVPIYLAAVASIIRRYQLRSV